MLPQGLLAVCVHNIVVNNNNNNNNNNGDDDKNVTVFVVLCMHLAIILFY